MITIGGLIYDPIFVLVKIYIISAPKICGGFEGVDLLDICSQITGVSSTLLVKSPDICDERIDTYIHSRAVIVTTALVSFCLFYSFPLLKFIVDIPFRLRRESLKSITNASKAEKALIARRANLSAYSTLSTIKTVVYSEADLDVKIPLIINALENLDASAKAKLL